MSNSKRRLRPGLISVFCMMIVNGIISVVVLAVLLRLFGVYQLLPDFAAHHAWAAEAMDWEMFGTLVPGAAIGFGLLWFWLVLTGRTQTGVSWIGGGIYGLAISLCNVPLSGLMTGITRGNPLLGLLLGLVVMVLVPAVLICMAVFGIAMGLLNGRMAHRWIERRYAGSGI